MNLFKVLLFCLTCSFISTSLNAAPGDVLFSDDFERATLGVDWIVNNAGGGDAGISTQAVNSPTRSLFIRWDPITVTSISFDLSVVAAAELAFWFRRGDDNFSEDPDFGEDLVVEYLNSSNVWIELSRYAGDGVPGEILTPVLQLPSDALHANFQFRYRHNGGNGQFGCTSNIVGCDYHHIDDVVLTERAATPPIVGGFCDDFEGGLGNWSVLPVAGGSAGIGNQTFSSASNSLFLRWNGVNVESRTIDMSAETAADLSLWIRRGSDAFSEDPDTGENLVIEYLNSSNNWVILETFTGAGTAGEIFNRVYSLPNDALHIALKIRFRMTSGNGADFDYWHIDDMCAMPPPPPAACSASFTDGLQSHNPGGEIIFDNNAFLSGSPDGILDAGSINNNGGNSSCTSQGTDCLASGSAVPAMTLGAFETQTGGVNLTVNNNGTGSLGTAGQANYINVNVGLNATLNSNAGISTYWISSLFADRDSVLNLTAGTYWIDDLFLGRDAQINVIGAGTVRIISRTQMFFDQDVILNGGITGDPSKLFLASFGDITFDNNSNVAAIVFAQGDVDLQNGTQLIGAVTGDDIRLRNNTSVTYDATAVGNTNFGGFCSAPAVIDHIEIVHDGVGLTCNAEILTVKACGDAACTVPATIDTTVTLAATGLPSVWTPATILIPANSAAGVQISLNHTAAEVITLSSTSVPAAVNLTQCTGSLTGCNIEFFDSGFVFDVPNQTSCATSLNVKISAVRKDIITQQCVPGFASVSKTLKFWTDYVDPSPVIGTPQLNLTHGAFNGLIATSEGTSVPVSFDGNGEANFTVNYADAGQLRLNASFDGTGAEAGLRMLGADLFVTVPAQLIVSNPLPTSSCPTNDANCSAFIAAGAPFDLTVTAACAATAPIPNSPTPNFQQNGISLSHSLVAPVAGSNGNLGVTSIDIVTGGTATVSQTISEVGVFNFTADPGAGNYLTETAPTGTSGSIGRFVPDRFTLTDNAPAFTDATCTFTYQDQSFGFDVGLNPQLTLTALNTAGIVTQNYGGDGLGAQDFWKLNSNLLSTRTYNNQVATFPGAFAATLNLAGDTSVDPTNYDGTAIYTVNGDQFTYNKFAPVPVPLLPGPNNDAPFDADVTLNFTTLDLTDSDGAFYDPDNNNAADPFVSSNIGNTNIRWGRWFLENAFGSELDDLLMVGQAQYYDGAQFVLNVDDSCTLTTATLDNPLGNLALGETNFATMPIPVISNGILLLTLTAPGVGNDGSIDVTIDNIPDWFTYDFDGNGVITIDDDAKATATFGIFSGKKPVIYWRQNFGN